METTAHDVLDHINDSGGSVDYSELLESIEGDNKDAHFLASMLQRDGYIYEPERGVVKIA